MEEIMMRRGWGVVMSNGRWHVVVCHLSHRAIPRELIGFDFYRDTPEQAVRCADQWLRERGQ